MPIRDDKHSLYVPTHLPLLQPTFHEPSMAVQSLPTPVDTQPPQDWMSFWMSTHSKSPVKPLRPEIGQASKPLGQREAARDLEWARFQ